MATQSVPPTVLLDKSSDSVTTFMVLDQVFARLRELNLDDLKSVEAAVKRLKASQSLDGLDGFAPAVAAG